MKQFFVFALLAALSFNVSADDIQTRSLEEEYQKDSQVTSVTTEPTPLPDPVDQPPVLEYGKAAVAATAARTPSSWAPQKYVDSELGIACYYIVPPTIAGVATPLSAAISCVAYEPKIIPVLAPQKAQTAPPATTN